MQPFAVRPSPSTNKRVILYYWDRLPTTGIVNVASFLADDHIEWVTSDGRFQLSPLQDCKALCFVSESAKPDLFTDNNLFERRPKIVGLWTRFYFRDNTVLDGVIPQNFIEWPDNGYLIIPPHARANRQKVFIPRLALVKTDVKGVIGGTSSSGQDQGTKSSTAARQLTIFDS
jgi:hypothetical protein